MFCKNCGSNIGNNVKFCPSCGKPTGVSGSPQPDGGTNAASGQAQDIPITPAQGAATIPLRTTIKIPASPRDRIIPRILLPDRHTEPRRQNLRSHLISATTLCGVDA